MGIGAYRWVERWIERWISKIKINTRSVCSMCIKQCYILILWTNKCTFLIIKPTRCTNFSNLFLEWNSTCFGQFLCPSWGIFHCIHSNGICYTGLLTAVSRIGMELDYQEFFTVHTAMVYVIQVCWQLASRIRMELRSILILLASCLQNCMTYTIAVCTVKNSWWWAEELSEIRRFSFQE